MDDETTQTGDETMNTNRTQTATVSISISRDGIWAGVGRLNDAGEIVDCPAVLGDDQDASDDTYEAIESDIDYAEGEGRESGRVDRPDGVYEWSISERINA